MFKHLPSHYHFQQHLYPTRPKLPVPSLQQTLKHYLRTLLPITTPNVYNEQAALVQSFLNDPYSQVLQDRLIEKSHSKYGWLHEMWNDHAYLSFRDRCAGNVNFFYQLNPLPSDQVDTAAKLIRELMGFYSAVQTETLPADKDQCGHMYRYLYSTRVPQIPKDTIHLSKSTHILVLYKHQPYLLYPVHQGALLSINDLKHQLRAIMANGYGSGIGALTSQHRDTWAKQYSQLDLASINDAAFCVCLDDTSPVSLEEGAKECLYGDIKNRWFDKSFQIIVFKNGEIGINNEHSMMDGTITTRMMDTVMGQIGQDGPDVALLEPTKVAIDCPDEWIQEAKRDFDQWDNRDYRVLAYYGYGKSFLKTMGVSPDAFMQMVLQYSYYKLHDRCVPTYESASIRKYQYGRTETCRTCSVESVAFCKEMAKYDGKQSNDALNALKKGIEAHVGQMKRCVNGEGVDRHLLGLKKMVKEGETMPGLFNEVYDESCYWIMSTSQLSSEHFKGYGWIEVVPEGYGLAYCIKKESLHVNVVTQLDAGKMYQSIVETLESCRRLFLSAKM